MRINQLTEAVPTSSDYLAFDGSNGTKKMPAIDVLKVTGTISGATTTVNKTGVTSDMEVIGLQLGTPSAITSAIGWQTLSGQLKITTTVSSGGSSTFTAYVALVR